MSIQRYKVFSEVGERSKEYWFEIEGNNIFQCFAKRKNGRNQIIKTPVKEIIQEAKAAIRARQNLLTG